MDAAPRPELIRELTREYRKRFEEEQEGVVVGGCTVEEFEEIVERFIGLGARELEMRAEEEREREQEQAEQEGRGEMSEMTSAGGESDRPAKRQRTERYEAMTDVSEGESEVEAVVTRVVPSREVWTKWSAKEVYRYFREHSGCERSLSLESESAWKMDGARVDALGSSERVL